MTPFPVIPIERAELSFAPRRWRFADERRAEIDAHFDRRRRERRGIWNGRALLMSEFSIADGVLRGSLFETDYASCLAWRDWGFPDQTVFNCFSAAAVRTADGAFVLGVMAAHTAAAGNIYFPCGSLDQNDIVGGTVDIEGNIRRELAEEIGLDAAELSAETGWHVVLAGPRIAVIKLMTARETEASLAARIRAHIGSETEPELAGIRFARRPADLGPAVPAFVTAYLDAMWRR